MPPWPMPPLSASAIRLTSSSTPGGAHGGRQRLDLGEEVVAHPRHGGELHAVGLLVQAHPQPEVARVGAELALDVDDVGGHEQQPAVGGVERVELAQHLAGQEAEQPADLDAGDPRADGQGRAGGRLLRRRACRPAAPTRWRKASALAWIQPGRSTTRTGAVWSAATRPVKSRTSAVERSAPARSSATASSASAARDRGPSPASREAMRTARSQSTISAARSGGWVMRSNLPGAHERGPRVRGPVEDPLEACLPPGSGRAGPHGASRVPARPFRDPPRCAVPVCADEKNTTEPTHHVPGHASGNSRARGSQRSVTAGPAPRSGLDAAGAGAEGGGGVVEGDPARAARRRRGPGRPSARTP